jgi:fission process protein 1
MEETDTMNKGTVTQTVQKKVENFVDDNVDSKDTDVRYLAYASRLRTALRASTRYVAYVRALFA